MAFLPARFRDPPGSKISLEDVEQIKGRYRDAGFSIPKYLQFVEAALNYQCRVYLYDAQTTVSKYVTLMRGKRKYKVRFSNHKPNLNKEKNGESDFFVGVTNLAVTTTDDAWRAALAFFNLKWRPM